MSQLFFERTDSFSSQSDCGIAHTPELRSGSPVSGQDGLVSTLLRCELLPDRKSTTPIHKLLVMTSRYGEVQSIETSRLQFDSTFTVSYFDIRAASLAKSSIERGEIPHISLHIPRHPQSPFLILDDQPPSGCSVLSRCVDVSGFPTWDGKYKDLLVAVFSKFGEIDCISHNSSNEYRVLYFDSRSPLAVLSALHAEPVYTDHVQVTSEDLVPLFLAGAPAATTPPPAPKQPSLEKTNEFTIHIPELESGHETRSTVMIRNVPRSFDQKTVIDLLNRRFKPRSGTTVFDFVYLPMDLVNRVNVGYVFINLTEPRFVSDCLRLFNSRTWRSILEAAKWPSMQDPEMGKVARVTFARIQGRDALMEHFNKSSIMTNHSESIRPYFVDYY